MPLEGLIDFAQERERLGREREKLQKKQVSLIAACHPNSQSVRCREGRGGTRSS